MLSDKAFEEMNIGAEFNIEFHLAFICASLNYFQLLELQQTLLLYNKQTWCLSIKSLIRISNAI